MRGGTLRKHRTFCNASTVARRVVLRDGRMVIVRPGDNFCTDEAMDQQRDFGSDGLPNFDMPQPPDPVVIMRAYAEHQRLLDNILWPRDPGGPRRHRHLHQRTMRMFADYYRQAAQPEVWRSKTDALLHQYAAALFLRDRNKYLEGLGEHIEGGGVQLHPSGVCIAFEDGMYLSSVRWSTFTKAILAGEPVTYEAIDAITHDIELPHVIEFAQMECVRRPSPIFRAALIELLEATERQAGKEAPCQRAG